jgi:hypothetical protein
MQGASCAVEERPIAQPERRHLSGTRTNFGHDVSTPACEAPHREKPSAGFRDSLEDVLDLLQLSSPSRAHQPATEEVGEDPLWQFSPRAKSEHPRLNTPLGDLRRENPKYGHKIGAVIQMPHHGEDK